MRFVALLIPAFLAALAIATPIEDLEGLHRRDCPGHPVKHAACPWFSFQVSIDALEVMTSEEDAAG
jgi:hypothetical protein